MGQGLPEQSCSCGSRSQASSTEGKKYPNLSTADRIMSSQKTPRSSSWNVDYVTLYARRDTEDVIKLRNLEMGRLSCIIWVDPMWSQGLKSERDVRAEAEVTGERRCSAAGVEEGGRGYLPRKAAGSRSWKMEGSRFFSRASSRNQPHWQDNLISTQRNWFRILTSRTVR